MYIFFLIDIDDEHAVGGGSGYDIRSFLGDLHSARIICQFYKLALRTGIGCVPILVCDLQRHVGHCRTCIVFLIRVSGTAIISFVSGFVRISCFIIHFGLFRGRRSVLRSREVGGGT